MSGKFVVWEIGKGKWIVLSLNSSSGRPKQYFVTTNGYRFLCNCPHFLKNAEDVNFTCKHIQAVLKVIGKEIVNEDKDIDERIKKIEDIKKDIEYICTTCNI